MYTEFWFVNVKGRNQLIDGPNDCSVTQELHACNCQFLNNIEYMSSIYSPISYCYQTQSYRIFLPEPLQLIEHTKTICPS